MPVSSGLGAKTLNRSYERSMPEKEGQFSHWWVAGRGKVNHDMEEREAGGRTRSVTVACAVTPLYSIVMGLKQTSDG